MYDTCITIKEALESAGIERLDAEVLLADLLGKNRAWLHAHPQEEIADLTAWRSRITRRKMHEPVAYITGRKEFYGRDFHVSADTLIPRPATETLIDLLMNFLQRREDEIRIADSGIVCATKVLGNIGDNVRSIIDIGTGSGCIAVTLKLELPEYSVYASDISERALRVAKENAQRLGAVIDFRSGNLLDPFTDFTEPFIIVSNPPYIPDNEVLDADVSEYEPSSALFGGNDGADILRLLLKVAINHKFCKGVVIECKADQWLEFEK